MSAAKKKTTHKPEAPKKRGRRPKGILWQSAPRNGKDLTLESANKFADEIVDELPPQTFETYRYWQARYDEALYQNGRTRPAAKKHATAQTARHFSCNMQTVRNRIGALKANLNAVRAWQEENVFPLMHEYNRDVKRLTEAQALLRDKAYTDLEKVPVNFSRFRGPDASQPDSPQRLASVLAAAFIQAHSAALAAELRAAAAETTRNHAQTRLAGLVAASNAGLRSTRR